MKSLRNFGLTAVLLASASQGFAMGDSLMQVPSAVTEVTENVVVPALTQEAPEVIAPIVEKIAPVVSAPIVSAPIVSAPVAQTFWKKALESVKSKGSLAYNTTRDWSNKTFTKENAGKVWTSTKDGIKNGYKKSSKFVVDQAKALGTLVKNHPYRTGAIVAGTAASITALIIAYKKGWFGKAGRAIKGLFVKGGAKNDKQQAENMNKCQEREGRLNTPVAQQINKQCPGWNKKKGQR